MANEIVRWIAVSPVGRGAVMWLSFEEVAVKQLVSLKALVWGIVVMGIPLIVAGCVTRETYEAQVKRATNLQRLLADEEKKRNTDARKFRREVRELETLNLEMEDRNRELSAQVAILQDEEARIREEIGFLQLQPTAVPDIQEQTMDIEDVSPFESFEVSPQLDVPVPPVVFGDELTQERNFLDAMEQPLYHVVKPGDTLWGISKRYATKVQLLRELNGLVGDEIYVGQNLLVGYQ